MSVLFNNGGDYAQAVQFPSAAQYVMSTQVTMCCWLYVVDWPVGTSMYNDFMARLTNYIFAGNNGSPRGIRFQYNTGVGYNTLSGTSEFVLNTWIHCSATFNSAAAGNNCFIYKNGYLETGTRFTESIADTGGGIDIGGLYSAFPTNPKRFFHGAIDDARIYNRALTPYEILTIWSSRGRDDIKSNLVFRTVMNELNPSQTAGGTGTVKELSSYINHGTAVNSPYYYGSSLSLRKDV